MKKEGNFYQAQIHIRGNYRIGIYETAQEAAIAYNKAIDILKKMDAPKISRLIT